MVSTSTEINLQSNMLEVGLELPESQVAKSEVLVEKKKKKKSKRRGRLRSRATEVVESALSKSQIEEKEAPVSLSGDMEALDLAIEGTANFRGKNEFARDKSVVQVVPPKESLSVSELEDSDEMQSNKITLADGSFKNSLFPTSVPTIFQLLEASFTESYHII
ncbi:hypothetical protein YC2023_066893 [Brassica napus]